VPKLDKEALSQYIRTECQRQLRLNLSPHSGKYKAERQALGMPDPQPPRPGLEQITQAGEEWQAAKLNDLACTFGPGAVVGQTQPSASGQSVYQAVPLATVLPSASAGQFLVEAEYDVGKAFSTALGIAGFQHQPPLDYAEVRPDIIEVLPANHIDKMVSPNGDVSRLPVPDHRLQLRIIDIKLTSEPSPSYFAEVAYYSMTLAAWLIDHGLDHRFVVVPEGAVWPGSHDASFLTKVANELRTAGQTPTPSQLRAALQQDLELVPFEVFAFRVRRFLQEDVPYVLSVPWQSLEWHVDNRCKGCDNLGYPWQNQQGQPTNLPDHCMPMAANLDHLCRIAFVPRGASAALRAQGIHDVASLALLPASAPAFDTHQSLRAMRTVVSGRAASLQLVQPQIPPQSGSSAVMPKWTDLHIYLSVDFDLGSAITFAFGIKAFWLEPRPFGSTNTAPRQTQQWPARTFLVDQKDLAAEQRELTAFLDHINAILVDARRRDRETTVQFYLWDSLQFEHLCRVIGRHLQALLANQGIRHLAWLFPPEELLPNPSLVTRQSPLTIVRDVVRAVLAAPIPHYYSLLETARVYHLPSANGYVPRFWVHPLFEDVLSDQIPSERAHEIWTHSTRPYWMDQQRHLASTVSTHLEAVEAIVRRLETDLHAVLGKTAPQINIDAPQRRPRVSFDGQLWYAFSRLDSALNGLEVHQIRAMPPHEREARFHSALLPRRLQGPLQQQALTQLGLSARPGRRVYELGPGSREVKLKEGDFNCALAPEGSPGFLDIPFPVLADATPLQQQATNWQELMERVTAVTIVALDRTVGLVVVDADSRRPTILDELERHGLVDLSRDVVLDPVHRDFFLKKLLASLQAIGNPPPAQSNSQVRQALGQSGGRGSRPTTVTPAADVLWDAPTMHQTAVTRALPPVQAVLKQYGLDLNPQQWVAWQAALSHRLQLVWGPPGTGKSRTARAILAGALLEAYRSGQALRVLICTSTHTAMDNVLIDVYGDLAAMLPNGAIEVHRLRSKWRPVEPHVPAAIDTEVNRDNPSPRVGMLQARLRQSRGLTLVGGTPEQVHNLLVLNNGTAQQEFFDLILIDEASQMDVAHAILPLAALASRGSVVLAGDPKQLPPIHQAEAPLNLEHLVGSVYHFVATQPGIAPVMLDQNYRSCACLVEFSHRADYPPTLTSFSPHLQLDLLQPLPTTQPPGWPSCLSWTAEWSALLDPSKPATCFVYREGRSSQWNQFEADAVAALVATLHGRLANQLCNERDAGSGQLRPRSNVPYSVTEFWEKAIGVVTPHRAQQGLIIGKLHQIFGGTGVPPELIRNAVDTVERFQGQQRDVILATFALGDPDAIQAEDEFLLSLNRFNVMSSRARAKLIVLVTQELVDHLSSDLDTLRGSKLLKLYVESFCSQSRQMTLCFLGRSGPQPVGGQFKWAS
jgi:hypothetical protein